MRDMPLEGLDKEERNLAPGVYLMLLIGGVSANFSACLATGLLASTLVAPKAR